MPQHLLDSARIAGHLWEDWVAPGTRTRIESELSITPADGHALASWLAGTHDIGKLDPRFCIQAERQTPYLLDHAREGGLRFHPLLSAQSAKVPHAQLGQIIIQNYLTERFEFAGRVPQHLASVAGAHHGLPMSGPEKSAATGHLEQLRRDAPEWTALHFPSLDAITAETGAQHVLRQLAGTPLSSGTQMVLTGLVIMADWIASNADYAPFSPTGRDDNPERALEALRAVDLSVPWLPVPPDRDAVGAYAERFAWPPEREPHPMQVDALELARSVNQGDRGLLIIEAPMGQGKTEAALLAAEELAQANDCGGIMVAAPTMATANGLFDRVTAWAQQAMGGREDPASLYLAHSKAGLNESYRALQRTQLSEDSQHGQVIAHAWLSGRKKGLLSNTVVGTIDQLLLAALQSKHLMLRHLGLAQKVVIIDEAHAADTYMSEYLHRALTWLGRYGVPVVVLSATLPHSQKQKLVDAYLDEQPRKRANPPLEPAGNAYPVLTLASRRGITVRTPKPSDHGTRVAIETMGDGLDVLRGSLEHVAAEGGCAAVVCSTVDRAQEAYRIARELVDDDARLLHSRFAAKQRASEEAELLAALGPRASRKNDRRPRRRIVVATQVIEQSLDLDFDYMITDIAPTDLVLQRLGRLHRHRRPAEDRPAWAQTPRVSIRGFSELPAAAAPPRIDPVIELIYPPALLMRSVAALGLTEPGPKIELPSDIPAAVHATYEDYSVPPAWAEQHKLHSASLEQARRAQKNRARNFLLGSGASSPLGSVYGSFSDDVGRDRWGEQRGLAKVRDGDSAPEVILIQQTANGYRLLPWLSGEDVEFYRGSVLEDRDAARLLAASTVRLPHHFADPRWVNDVIEELEQMTDVATGGAWAKDPLLNGELALPLDDRLRVTLRGRELECSRDLGLILRKKSPQSPTDAPEDLT
ncbi:CRISPR-associated helicase/endonuclease Cas3 [Zhihengliuella somnathii]